MGITINSTAVAVLDSLGESDAAEEVRAAIGISAEESVAMLIEDFGGIQEVRNDTYGRLHSTVAGAGSLETAVKLLDDAEIIFINNNFSEAERLKETTKSGKIKRTKFLPNDYLSAKSVLIGCLEKGIPLFDADGNPMGKSALSDKRSGKVEKTTQMKLDETLTKVLNYVREIYGEDITEILVCDKTGTIVTKKVAA